MSSDAPRGREPLADTAVPLDVRPLTRVGESPWPTPEGESPPVARVAPRVEELHGERRVDEYHWLRDRDNPDVIAYLEAENRYTQATMRHTEALQEQLYRELVGRIKETDLSVPERRDSMFYYRRTEAGRQYPIICRRCGSPDGAEEILLDQNALAEGAAYNVVASLEVSPDHALLAYAVDTTGSEEYTLVFKDLTTGALLPESIARTAPGVAWASDSRTIFYVELDANKRPWRVCRHRLGTDPSDDTIVHEETDGAFFASVARSRSGDWILLDLASHSTSETRVLEAGTPESAFRVIEPRRHGIEYSVAPHGDRFFITTNDDAENFRLVEAPASNPSRQHWRDVLPHDPTVRFDGAEAFRDHLVVLERHEGLRRIRVLDFASGEWHHVRFPEPVYTFHTHTNPEFAARELRFTYTSLVTPPSVVEYDLATRDWTVRKQTEVLGGHDPAHYRSERIFAVAPDGTRVPVSLVYRVPFERNGSRPMLLLGYGAYGLSYDPAFSSNHLSLLDRGFVVAIAHVRGGEEMGRRWYHDGKLMHKRNTFTDFIAAAEHLVDEGYADRSRLAIAGGSAGGMLMGAVTNLRPDLFRAVVADVPFVDVINTMLDASLPLTVIEYDEWGDPRDRAAYEYIRSYSPYDNVERKAYPHLLVTAGLNDPRVTYWEPAKWVARLRAHKTDGNRLLLKTNMGAGHGGASGRYDSLREVAFRYAFVLDVMEMA